MAPLLQVGGMQREYVVTVGMVTSSSRRGTISSLRAVQPTDRLGGIHRRIAMIMGHTRHARQPAESTIRGAASGVRHNVVALRGPSATGLWSLERLNLRTPWLASNLRAWWRDPSAVRGLCRGDLRCRPATGSGRSRSAGRCNGPAGRGLASGNRLTRPCRFLCILDDCCVELRSADVLHRLACNVPGLGEHLVLWWSGE